MKRAFSLVEVILATAIFAIVAVGGIMVIVSGLNGNRLGGEEAVAVGLATEGIEAMRSIKNQAFANATSTTGTGVTRNGNIWAYGGTENYFDGSRYKRVITVSDVNRDGTGAIVPAPNGCMDPNTKKITSKVSWNFTDARPEDVTINTYITNWRAGTTNRGGLLVYGDSTTFNKYRAYDWNSGKFGSECAVPAGTAGENFSIKTSPLKKEAIAGYVTGGGVLQVMCYDGTGWNNEWSVTVGGTGTSKRFGIAYETGTGNAMVVYSKNTGTANAIGFRRKPAVNGCGGANWSSESILPVSPAVTSGVVQWIRLENNPAAGSNKLGMAWSDANSDLGAAIWSGSAWGNLPATALEVNLENAGAVGDTQVFDLAFENQTGNLLVAWGVLNTKACAVNNNCMRYARFTSSWTAAIAIPTVADGSTSIDMSGDPGSNQIILGAIDNLSGDMSIAYWSGTAWTGLANVDTTVEPPAAGTKLIATGWLESGGSTRSVVVYNDNNATNIGWYVCNAANCTAQNDFTPSPTFANPQKWYDIQTDPIDKNQLVLLVSDNSNRLTANILTMTSSPIFTWTNAAEIAGTYLEPSLTQPIASPFSYAYWKI